MKNSLHRITWLSTDVYVLILRWLGTGMVKLWMTNTRTSNTCVDPHQYIYFFLVFCNFGLSGLGLGWVLLKLTPNSNLLWVWYLKPKFDPTVLRVGSGTCGSGVFPSLSDGSTLRWLLNYRPKKGKTYGILYWKYHLRTCLSHL